MYSDTHLLLSLVVRTVCRDTTKGVKYVADNFY